MSQKEKDLPFEYRVIRSLRKSISIGVTEEGVIVRAPYLCSDRQIRAEVVRHQRWILNRLKKWEDRKTAAGADPISDEEIRRLSEEAKKYIPQRVAYYAPKIGVTYGRITIRHQRTRWGSCSSKGNLNFNCLLMLMPPEVIDSVVVHELCHRKQMNHSKKFYDEVYRVYPEYDRWNVWLKEHGNVFLDRMTVSDLSEDL